MNYEEVQLNSLLLVGISVRTTNQGGKAQGDIGNLWNEFIANNLVNKIPNKISTDVYCIYTDYESDFTGEYTTFIGCVVSQADNLPEGFDVKEIEATKYYKFISKGAIPECVGKTWTHIWENNYKRAYKADFDIYGADIIDPSDAEIITYLSIK